MDFDRDVYIRKVEIENLLPMPRDVRLFWHHDFNINGAFPKATRLITLPTSRP